MKITMKQKIILVICVMVILGTTLYKGYMDEKKEVYILSSINNEKVKASQEKIVSIEVADEIIIHIEGEVNQPGIYRLNTDARVFNAVEAAGGLKDTADRSKVNLAKRISDEEFIYIPSEDDINLPLLQQFSNNRNDVMININTATQNQLEGLTGIGSVLANRIIEYRETNGLFNTIEEIQNVNGIGTARFQDINDRITVN